MKKRRKDLLLCMLIALSLHVAAGIGIGTLAVLQNEAALPVFRKGESAVELVLEPVPVHDQRVTVKPPRKESPEEPPDKVKESDVRPEPESEPEPEEITMEENKSEHKPEEPEKEEEQKSLPEPRAADLQKGVETLDLGETEINPSYPLGAQMRGEEGVVKLEFTIGKRGSIRSVRVVSSSGYSALDNAAVEAVQRASFRGVSGLPPEGKTAELVIRFELEE